MAQAWALLRKFLGSDPTSMRAQKVKGMLKESVNGVDTAELLHALGELGLRLSYSQAMALHADCDLNGDGVVTLQEFAHAIGK